MAVNRNAFYVVNEAEYRWSTPTQLLVASGAAATIQAGSPAKGTDSTGASWTGAVIPMVDGDGTTSQRFAGVAKSDSTDTASAAGYVYTWTPLPGLVYAGAAKTASTANTAALVQALFGKRVVFDLTSNIWSIDTAAADAAANMVVIVGGDFNKSLIYWTYKATGTVLGQIA